MKNKNSLVKLIIPLCVIGLLVIGLVYWLARSPRLSYSTTHIKKGNLVETVSAAGKVEAVQNADLSFERPGKISQIKVAVGDKVKAGQILVMQQNDDYAAQLAQAQAALDKQLAGSTQDYIAQLQAAVDKAQADLAEAAGANSGVEDSKMVSDAYDNLFASLLSTQTSLQTGLNAAAGILGMDNQLLDNPYIVTAISNLDPSVLEKAKDQYIVAKNIKIQFDNQLNQLTNQSEHASVDMASSIGLKAMDQLKQLLFLTTESLNKTLAVGNLTQANLDGMKNNIQQNRTAINSQYALLIANVHAIDTARNSYYSFKALLDRAVAALHDAQNPPRSVDVAVTKAFLNLAQANYNKTVLYAPFDGVVSRLDAKIGQTVAAGAPQVAIISDKAYQMSVYLPESDVSKVKVGQTANVTLDNLGNNIVFSATVASVSLSPENTANGVLSYKTILQFDKEDEQIKPGLTANIKIVTAQKDNVLLISARDVVQKNGEYFATVEENGKFLPRQISLGLGNSQTEWEVLNGLSENDTIVSYGKN